jgi:hypothetical protein
MIKEIKTIENVLTFARQLRSEGCVFHPDDDFNDYVNIKTDAKSYTEKQADLRNKLMDQCFDVCDSEGVDIYHTMRDVNFDEEEWTEVSEGVADIPKSFWNE